MDVEKIWLDEVRRCRKIRKNKCHCRYICRRRCNSPTAATSSSTAGRVDNQNCDSDSGLAIEASTTYTDKNVVPESESPKETMDYINDHDKDNNQTNDRPTPSLHRA
eukprot:14656039-Ditylum_brightwellii.AAC.1